MITNVILSYYQDNDTISLVFVHPDACTNEHFPSEYLVKCSDKVLFRSYIREQAEKYFFGLYMESYNPSNLF